MITTEEAIDKLLQVCNELTLNEQDNSSLTIYQIIDLLVDIKDNYILQQQKKDKLLELYQKLFYEPTKTLNELEIIENEIRKLEKELKL